MYRPPEKLFPKKSDSYYTNFTVAGRRIRRSLRTNKKAEAERKSLRLYNELADSAENPSKKQSVTVNQVFGRYWREEGQYKASAYNSIKPQMQRWLEFLGGETAWNYINDEKIDQYIRERKKSYVPIMATKTEKDKKVTYVKGYTDRKISNKTINNELTLLSGINRITQEKWGVNCPDFILRKHILPIKQAEKKYFSQEEEKLILSFLPKYWQYAFRFALYTGVRIGNVVKNRHKNQYSQPIKRKNIWRDKGIISLVVKSKKVGGKIHEIPIIPELEHMLFEEMKIDSLLPDDYIFTYPKGHKLEGRQLGDYRKALYSAMDKAGFERKLHEGFHLTRHTTATRLVQSGIDMTIAQEVLGHADINTTKIYAHRNNQQRKEAMQKALMAENWQKEENEEDRKTGDDS